MTHRTTDNNTASQLELRLAALQNDQDAARRALEQAKDELGEVALGTDAQKTAQAAELVQQRHQDIQNLQAAREALERRLQAAREQDVQAAHDAKWATFEEALAHRDAMFDKAEAAARPFFEAVHAAIAASDRADKLEPVEKVLAPDGWHLMPRPFTGMANLKQEELAVVRNALYDMAAKSRTASANALRMREFDKPGSVTQFGASLRDVVIEPAPILEP